MKDSKKSIKVVTIAVALLIFGIGTEFAIQAAESNNSVDAIHNAVAAGNTVIEETQSQTESTVEAEPTTGAVVSYEHNTPLETEAPTMETVGNYYWTAIFMN